VIPFNKPFIVGKELYYIAQAVIKEAHLSGDGIFTRRCHEWLSARLGSPMTLLTPSCTAALEMSALLCDIVAGDEVVMPSFTFVSTANAFVLRGATPVFVDIRPDTLNLDEGLLQDAITQNTKAIVTVHYGGMSCAMHEILGLARKHNLFVIEDAAQALLSTYKGRYLGSIGDFGCLSFHETKNLISGEGGALLINNPVFAERAEIIREKGTNRTKFFRGEVDKYTWVDIGSSYLPSELIGAFLYAQLEEADRIIAFRRSLFKKYVELLEPLSREGLIRLPFIQQECTANGHIFYILTETHEERTALLAHLNAAGIHAVFHYIPLHSSPAGMRYGRVSGSMETTESVSGRLLRLPLYHGMTDSELASVTEGVRSFYKN
jgi:dTDP-4-amino-4,6-dideoxygalactose transaminase